MPSEAQWRHCLQTLAVSACMRRSGYGAVGRQSCRGHPREVTTGGLSGNAMGRQPWAQGKTSCRDGQGRRGRCQQRRQRVDTVSRSEGTGCRGGRMGCNGWSGRGSERVTRAGGKSILGGQGKEFRGQQRRLLCQSRGTGSTRPGSGGVSGRSVAQRNEPEAQLSIRLSDEPVEGGVHGCDGQG